MHHCAIGAIRFLPTISGSEWIWLHWGMSALALSILQRQRRNSGSILALQDDFTTSQVRDRMLNTWVTELQRGKPLRNFLIHYATGTFSGLRILKGTSC